MRFSLLSVVLLSGLTIGAVAADPPASLPIPFQTSFSVMDRPPVMPGQSLEGWQGWRVPRGRVTVAPFAGPDHTAAVTLSPESILRRPVDASGHSVMWTEVIFRTAGGTASTESLPDRPLGAVVLFDRALGLVVLDGDRAGGGELVPASVNIGADRWRRLTIRHNFVNQSFDLYVDGTARMRTVGFRDPVTELRGFDFGAQEAPGGMGEVHIGAEPPPGLSHRLGDVRINGVVNAGDIVALVNHLHGAALGLGQLINADVNLDGGVDESDLDALVNLMLGATP